MDSTTPEIDNIGTRSNDDGTYNCQLYHNGHITVIGTYNNKQASNNVLEVIESLLVSGKNFPSVLPSSSAAAFVPTENNNDTVTNVSVSDGTDGTVTVESGDKVEPMDGNHGDNTTTHVRLQSVFADGLLSYGTTEIPDDQLEREEELSDTFGTVFYLHDIDMIEEMTDTVTHKNATIAYSVPLFDDIDDILVVDLVDDIVGETRIPVLLTDEVIDDDTVDDSSAISSSVYDGTYTMDYEDSDDYHDPAEDVMASAVVFATVAAFGPPDGPVAHRFRSRDEDDGADSDDDDETNDGSEYYECADGTRDQTMYTDTLVMLDKEMDDYRWGTVRRTLEPSMNPVRLAALTAVREASADEDDGDDEEDTNDDSRSCSDVPDSGNVMSESVVCNADRMEDIDPGTHGMDDEEDADPNGLVSVDALDDIFDPLMVTDYYTPYLSVLMRSNSVMMVNTLTDTVPPRDIPSWIAYLESVRRTVPIHWSESQLNIRDSSRWNTPEQMLLYHYRSLLVFTQRNTLYTVNDNSIHPVLKSVSSCFSFPAAVSVSPTDNTGCNDDTIMVDLSSNVHEVTVPDNPSLITASIEELDDDVPMSNDPFSLVSLPSSSFPPPPPFLSPSVAHPYGSTTLYEDLYGQTLVLCPLLRFHLVHYKISLIAMARILGILDVNHLEIWLQTNSTNTPQNSSPQQPLPLWFQMNIRVQQFFIDLRNQQYRKVNAGYPPLPWYKKRMSTDTYAQSIEITINRTNKSGFDGTVLPTLTIHDAVFIQSMMKDRRRELLSSFPTDVRLCNELFQPLYLKRMETTIEKAWKRLLRYRSYVRKWEQDREISFVQRIMKEYTTAIGSTVSATTLPLYDWMVSKGYHTIVPDMNLEKFSDLVTAYRHRLANEVVNVRSDDGNDVSSSDSVTMEDPHPRKARRTNTNIASAMDVPAVPLATAPIVPTGISTTQPQRYAYRRLSTGYILYSDTYEGEQQDVCGTRADSMVYRLEESRCTICGLAQEYTAHELGNGCAVEHTLIECASCCVRIHPRCYGLTMSSLIPGSWLCDPCKHEPLVTVDTPNTLSSSSLRTTRRTIVSSISSCSSASASVTGVYSRSSLHDTIQCVVCDRPPSGLVMKETNDKQWIHGICAITNPYITFAYGQRHRLHRPDSTLLFMVRSFLSSHPNTYAVTDKVVDKCVLCGSGCTNSTSLIECSQVLKGCMHRVHPSCALQAGWLRVTHYTFNGLPPLPSSSSADSPPAVGEWNVPGPVPNLRHPLSQGPVMDESSTVFYPRFFLDIDLPPLSRSVTGMNGTLPLVEEFAPFPCENPKLLPLVQELHNHGYSYTTQQYICLALKRMKQLSLGSTSGAYNPTPGQMIPVRGMATENSDTFAEGVRVENGSSSSSSSSSVWTADFQALLHDTERCGTLTDYVPSSSFIETMYRRICSLSKDDVYQRLRSNISRLPLHFYYRMQCSVHSCNRPDPGRRFVGNGAGTVAGHIIPYWWFNNGYQSLNTLGSVIAIADDLTIPLGNQGSSVTPRIPSFVGNPMVTNIPNGLDRLTYNDTRDIIQERERWLSKYPNNGLPVPVVLPTETETSSSSVLSCATTILGTTIDVNDEMDKIIARNTHQSILFTVESSVTSIATEGVDESGKTVRKRRRTASVRKGNVRFNDDPTGDIGVPTEDINKERSSTVIVSSRTNNDHPNTESTTPNRPSRDTFTNKECTVEPTVAGSHNNGNAALTTTTSNALFGSRSTRSSRHHSTFSDDFIMLN